MLACIEGLFFYHLLDWVESKAFRLINAPNLTSPLQLRRDVAFLFIFYNYYFNCCSEDLGYCVPGPNNWWRNTRVASFSQEFCVEACHFRFDLENSCLFPHTVNLWNSFPSSIFSSSYNLSSFKCRVEHSTFKSHRGIDWIFFYSYFISCVIFNCIHCKK